MKTTNLLFNFNESPPIQKDLNLIFEFITQAKKTILSICNIEAYKT